MKSKLRHLAQKVVGLDQVVSEIRGLDSQIGLLRKQLELTRRDLLAWPTVGRASGFTMASSAGVAADSVDHLLPKGTAADNTRWPRLVVWAEETLGPKARFLDLGCSGGGLVFDFTVAGHEAAGVEGSNLSARFARAEWGTIRNSLFVADITKPFALKENGSDKASKFDLITAWEVLEHIPEAALPGLFENIARHLAKGGIFAASVATFEDVDKATGMRWHQTVKPKEWWLAKVASIAPELQEMTSGWQVSDFPRGSANPNIPWDWDAKTQPSLGFHLVLRNQA